MCTNNISHSAFSKVHRKLTAALGASLGLLIIGATGVTAHAEQIITDFNFDSLTLGSTIPTTAPGTDPFPQHTVYSVSGYPDDNDPSETNPLTGTVTVQNVGTLSKAAVMTTTQGGTGALFVDTQFQIAAPSYRLSFDIDVLDVPTTGMAQAGVGAPGGQAFAINVFGLDAQRLMRFAVSPTSATGGDFGYRLPGSSGDLVSFGSYVEGETHHVEFDADFSASTLNIFLDGAKVVNDAALLAAGTGVGELFIFQNGVDGVTNSVALDNVVSTVPGTAAPEPSACAMLAVGVGAIAGHRRRRQAAGV